MNAEPLFSEHWHRVRDVRPRLADDVVVTRHVYRGRPCHVLQRRATNVCHRLDPASFELVSALDGRVSVGELWERALLERDAEAPTQDVLTNLLAGLHAAELLVVEHRVPTEQLFERREKRRLRQRREQRSNPLYLRFALHDPDAWLTRLVPLSRVVFSQAAFVGWLTLLAIAGLTLILHADAFAQALADPSLLSPRTALLFALVYPPLKLLHELGHALAIKRSGGEVREIGLALMVLMPLPYVDASASSAFADKWDRMRVSSAGILVELAVAAAGAILWASATGTVSELGFVLLMTGGFSTLLVNGNPLLRFDGYYLLADWLEIPNLATRSRRAVFALLRAGLSGQAQPDPVAEDRRERIWLIAYGLASALYRSVLMLSIAWWLSGRFLVIGLLLAAFAVVTALLLPLLRGLAAVRRDPTLRAPRPLVLLAGLPALLLALLLWLPVPQASVARGVVWLPDEAILRASSACEIDRVVAKPGQDVRAGDVLFDCHDPELSLTERVLQARLDELDARLAGVAVSDPVEYERLQPGRATVAVELEDVRERLAARQHVAALDGRFDASGTGALQGRAMSRGDIVGFVVPPDIRTVRVALHERAVGRLDAAPTQVMIRVAGSGAHAGVHSSSILARTPRATRELNDTLLALTAPDAHLLDPGGDGRRLREPVFDLELAWPGALEPGAIGEYVGVRFVHPPAPLAGRWAQTLRRTFARRSRV